MVTKKRNFLANVKMEILWKEMEELTGLRENQDSYLETTGTGSFGVPGSRH